jgi:hypothetical protein
VEGSHAGILGLAARRALHLGGHGDHPGKPRHGAAGRLGEGGDLVKSEHRLCVTQDDLPVIGVLPCPVRRVTAQVIPRMDASEKGDITAAESNQHATLAIAGVARVPALETHGVGEDFEAHDLAEMQP